MTSRKHLLPILIVLFVLASLAFTSPARAGASADPIDGLTLSSLAGGVLSLIFSYAPGAKDWFGRLMPETKRTVMLVLLALSAIGIFVLGCGGYLQAVSCDKGGAIELAKIFIAALIANQATFLISPTVPARS